MSLFSEFLVLNSGLQRGITVRLRHVDLSYITEFETEAIFKTITIAIIKQQQ